MKPLLLCALLAVLGTGALRAVEGDKQTEARKVALELAGAFSNDGFKIRDGHWAGEVNPGERAIVAVNLYAGNEYWFSAGAENKGAKIGVQLFDENGKAMTAEGYQGEATAAAGFSPTMSGQYFVSIDATAGTPEPETFCLVYSYK